MAFYSDEELINLGFKFIGKNVKISKLSSIYGYENIEIGDNSRIDDFCIISSGVKGIKIGKFVHIACYSLIIGKENMTLSDFSGLSSRVSIYSSSDDYSGNFMTNPTVPPELTNVKSSPVFLGRHVIIGTNSTILPGVKIGDGSAIGAHSLVNKSVSSNKIAFGIPAKEHGERNGNMFILENKLDL